MKWANIFRWILTGLITGALAFVTWLGSPEALGMLGEWLPVAVMAILTPIIAIVSTALTRWLEKIKPDMGTPG